MFLLKWLLQIENHSVWSESASTMKKGTSKEQAGVGFNPGILKIRHYFCSLLLSSSHLASFWPQIQYIYDCRVWGTIGDIIPKFARGRQCIWFIQGGPKNSKLSYFIHIFAKYWLIFTIFFTSRLRKKVATHCVHSEQLTDCAYPYMAHVTKHICRIKIGL